MHPWLRKNAQTIVVAMLTAALTAGGPVIAANMVRSARNADKVDGKHAVASKVTKRKRRGKLVATNPNTGFLPNGIIKKAKDSNRLDGLDSTDFLGAGDVAADSHLLDGMDSSEFLAPTQNGMILWSSDPSDWKAVVGAGSLTLTPGTGQTLVDPQSASGNAQLLMTPDVPVGLYGKQLSVTGVEYCYDAGATHAIAQVAYERVVNAGGTPSTTSQVLDASDRTDDACRVFAIPDPALTSDSTFGLNVSAVWTADTTNLTLGRVTWVLAPTGTDATPLS